MVGQAVETKVSLKEGMALYGLDDARLFLERSCDTKMLMAWSRNTIVMAFRGTTSRKAAFYDLQVPLLSLATTCFRFAAGRPQGCPQRRLHTSIVPVFDDCNGYSQAMLYVRIIATLLLNVAKTFP